MAKLLTDELYEQVGKDVCREPAIAADLVDRGLTGGTPAYLEHAKEEILRPLAELDAQYDTLDRTLAENAAQAERSLPSWLRKLPAKEPAEFGGTVGCLSIMAIGALLIGASASSIATVTGMHWAAAIGVSLMLGALGAVVIRLRDLRYMRVQGMYALPTQVSERDALAEKGRELLTTAVRDAIRGLINVTMKLESNYELKLPVVRFDGLAEGMDARMFVSTRTKESLYRQMDQMPLGTIGIAGPRGVGKTTLLQTIAAEVAAAGSDPAAPRGLSIFTSVPVEYQGRDFVLHLYAAACKAVIDDGIRQAVLAPSAATMQKRALSDLMRDVQAAAIARTWEVLAPIATAMTAIGGLFVLLSVAAALETPAASPKPPVAAEQKAETKSAQPADPKSEPKSTGAADPPKAAPPSAEFRLGTVVKPDLLPWGLLFLIVGFAGMFKAHGPRIFSVFRRLADDGKRPLPEQAPRLPRGTEGATKLTPEKAQALGALADTAWEQIMEIRYQRSYTSGWTGSFKAPVAFDTGASAASTLAETQRSLPEIVESYKAFMKTVATQYDRIVIAIDELDKLESQDVVFRFMNEVKALFGVDRCFYLISVSDAAISDFERRGMNFSNVFDSALDAMVQASYFRRTECRSLLDKRTVGLPQSFLAVLEAMSAGLPRDLIRAARDLDREQKLMRGADGTGEVGLAELVCRMIRNDVGAKLFAIVTTVKTLSFEPATSEVLEIIHQLQIELETSDLTPPMLVTACSKLAERLREIELMEPPTEDRDDYLRLQGRVHELTSYLYLSATLTEFFVGIGDADTLKARDTAGAVRQLVRARQDLRVHPGIAFTRVSALRESLDMDLVRGVAGARKIENVAVDLTTG